MEREEIFPVPAEQEGGRIDSVLPQLREGLSRAAVQKLLAEGRITVDGRPCGKNYRLRAGENIALTLPAPRESEVAAQPIELDIVYEDADLLVVNKPQGMVVHPAAGNSEGTLVNALLYHCRDSLSGINGVLRPGIVHRIDKDTSGLLVVAKNDDAHRCLAAQLKEHSMSRIYEAVVCGGLKQEEGVIEAPIGRHPVKRKQMTVTDRHSRTAVTHYEVIRRYDGYTHVRLRLETGRTHQIRAHMAYIGHPVAGDPVYGKPLAGLKGQCLHARTLGFVHPSTGERMEFTSELPDDFQHFLLKLQNSHNN